MKTTTTKNRRNFLLAAGLGGAGVAAAMTGAAVKAKASAKVPAVDKATGYRATAHIEKYYKTTEV
jgi:nitrous oxide reductase